MAVLRRVLRLPRMGRKVAEACRLGGGLLGALLAGCGGVTEGTGAGPSSGDAAAEASSLGWSVRDQAPYSRHSSSLVIDSAGDRLIMFGGEGNDAWQLPLSGEEVYDWRQLLPTGERPPPGDASAVYDAHGQRILARFDRGPAGSYQLGEIWELRLQGTPTWGRLDPGGSEVEAEIGSGMVALDGANQRLFVVGGFGPRLGTWSLSLTGEPAWTRWGEAPAEYGVAFLPEFGGVALVFDAPRERLVAMTSNSRLWEMPLATGTWSPLEQVFRVPFGAAVFHDETAERVSFVREELLSFSLATNQLEFVNPQPELPATAGAVFDQPRNRALLYTAGSDGSIWQLSDDSAAAEPLRSGSMGNPVERDWTLVWDEARRSVVGFGGSTLPEAHSRAISRGAIWKDVRAGSGPRLFGPAAAYDTESEALIAFGGADLSGTDVNQVWRLSSKPGSRWQQLGKIGDGPPARSRAIGVYDSSERRLLVRGGQHNIGDYVYEAFDDVWALSLADNRWTKLEPTGDSPGARFGEAGVYDSGQHRLIVYGGLVGEDLQTDVHVLSLGDAPSWSRLEPSGEPPPTAPLAAGSQSTALYDSARARLLLVVPLDGTTQVFALELANEPSWHRFCTVGPAPNPGVGVDPLRAVLASDGIWISRRNGAFRFNLETPYCD